ncbi:PIN domain-containing protein [Actinomadura adrarensis]|uniref:PIN domain-containing protein n=1 Tax=Actinomadura adrarensis TaxID=1819600 RepID=A0ABW3CL66_9ACTN
MREAQTNDFRVLISAITPIEAQDVRTKPDRLRWFLSRLRIEPVTEEITMAAIDLLRTCGLHGHKYAIDAVVASTALRAPKPVVLLTSDADDMTTLCGKTIRVVPV